MDGTGITYLSRYKSSTAKSFAGRTRELSNKNVTPGPGAYQAFSEFGVADSKYAARFRESQEKIKKNSCERLNRRSKSNGFMIMKNKKSFNKTSFDMDNRDRSYLRYFENEEEVKYYF
jgi:hypothetical protein